MRLTLSALSIVLATNALGAQGGALLRPAPSGRGTSEVRLAPPRTPGADAPSAGQSVIKIDYGQPHLRGRKLFTDSLVPYEKPWRMGANNSTTLSTDVDLVLGGATIPKGTYVLFALPSKAGWKLLVQKNAGQNEIEYDVANDVARVDLRRRELSSPIESLTMWLIPALEPVGSRNPARGELRIAWGSEELSVPWSVK